VQVRSKSKWSRIVYFKNIRYIRTIALKRLVDAISFVLNFFNFPNNTPVFPNITPSNIEIDENQVIGSENIEIGENQVIVT